MDRRKKGEYVGALGALLVHVAVIALLILVSFTVPQPDEDAGGVPVMMGNVDAASGFDEHPRKQHRNFLRNRIY